MRTEFASESKDPLSRVFLRKDSYTAFQLYHASPQCVYRDTRCILIGGAPTTFLRERRFRRAMYKLADRVSSEKELDDLMAKAGAFELGVVETIADGGSWVGDGHIEPKPKHRIRRRTGKQRLRVRRNRKTFAQRNVQVSHFVEPVPMLNDPRSSADLVSAINELSHKETSRVPNNDELKLDIISVDPAEATSTGSVVHSVSTPPTPASSSPSPKHRILSHSRDLSVSESAYISSTGLATIENLPSEPDTDTASFYTTHTDFETPEGEFQVLRRAKTMAALLPDEVSSTHSPLPSAEPNGDSDHKSEHLWRSRSQDTVISPFRLEEASSISAKVEEDVQQFVAPLLQLNGERIAEEQTEAGERKPVRHRLLRKRRGEVIFVRRFLMQVREVKRPVGEKTNLDEFTADSKVVDRWKEYTVVARRIEEEDAQVALYFYKGLEVDKVEHRIEHRWSHSFRFKLCLTSDWRAGIYSSVDMAAGLWQTKTVDAQTKSHSTFGFVSGREDALKGDKPLEKEKHDVTTVYVFKAQNGETMSSWLVFLYIALRYDVKRRPLKVHISYFDLTIQIPSSVIVEAAQSVLTQKNNEIVSYREALGMTSSPALVISSMLNYVHATLAKLDMWKCVSELPDKVAMAWRRFDRLLWIDDRSDIDLLQSWAMDTAFDLEFLPEYSDSRPLPLWLGSKDGKTLYEPPPVEGFCTRQSQWSGRRRRQQLANVTYLHTHSNLLAYSTPAKARPPLPFVNGKVAAPSAEVFDALPTVWEVAPYALNESGHVDWIVKCRSLKEFDARNGYAEFERDRRTQLLAECEGVIDMLTIDTVVESQKNETAFAIVFKSGKSVHFAVRTAEIRDSWVKQLNDLVLFWNLRKETDSVRQRAYYRYNLARLAFDDDEAMVRNTEKSQLDLAMVDSYTFSSSQLVRNRSVVHCDYLYMKDHKYASFRKFLGVLTRSDLILFEVKLDRTQRFSCRQQIYYKKRRCIKMKNAYFYTGILARDHLMDRDRYFEVSNPGVKALPRAFPNGWTSQDTEIDRCLVIWTSSVKIDATDKDSRRATVFLADSRFRRDRWATAIHHVLGNAPAAKVRVRGEENCKNKGVIPDFT